LYLGELIICVGVVLEWFVLPLCYVMVGRVVGGYGGVLSLPWFWLSDVFRRTILCGDLRSSGRRGLVRGSPCSSWASQWLEGGRWVSFLVFGFWGCVSECKRRWVRGRRTCLGVPDVMCHSFGLRGFVFLCPWLLCRGWDVICFGGCSAWLGNCVREVSLWWCFL
jgi:hypothetical protein